MTEGTLRVDGGYLDLQINGGWGHHFSDDPSTIWDVGARLPAHGVTQFLPTLVSAGAEQRARAAEVLAAGPPSGWQGATPLGLHLEGPWLNPARAGAHDRAALESAARPESLVHVRLVTLAPELDGALDVITELSDRGIVVSCGHSDASYEEAANALCAGATMGTHLFNAMTGLHHRDPGLAASLLLEPWPAVGLIADGEHVAPPMLDLAWRLAGERIVLVSDAISLLGTTDAPVGRLANGTLAGATVGLDQCVRTMARHTGREPAEIVPAASTRPRALLGEPTPPDAWAELDASGTVLRTVVGGRTVFEC